MAAFAISILAVASRETMPTLYQVSTDWTIDFATLFLPDDFYHPQLCITNWEQGKVVWRMEGHHGENASMMAKWVQLKDGIPTEVIGIPTVTPSDLKSDENNADADPPDPALRSQYKNPPYPGSHPTIVPIDPVMPLPCLPLVAHSKVLPSQTMPTVSAPLSKALTKAPLMISPHPLLLQLEEAETIRTMNIKLAKTISWPTQDP